MYLLIQWWSYRTILTFFDFIFIPSVTYTARFLIESRFKMIDCDRTCDCLNNCRVRKNKENFKPKCESNAIGCPAHFYIFISKSIPPKFHISACKRWFIAIYNALLRWRPHSFPGKKHRGIVLLYQSSQVTIIDAVLEIAAFWVNSLCWDGKLTLMP